MNIATLGASRGTAKEVLSDLMSSVDAFVGATRQHDDIACMVVKR